MQIRYLGFDQRQSARVYRFDVRVEGALPTEALVTADIAIFRTHSIAIQDGPLLCGNKLTADLERGFQGEHELTAGDVRAHADAKALAEAQRAVPRKPRRRPGSPTDGQTEAQPKPWGRFGLR